MTTKRNSAFPKYHPVFDPENPHPKPLVVHHVKMLVEGGPFNVDNPLWDYSRKRWIKPKRPQRVEYYPGEFHVEPDYVVSNLIFTGKLVKRMLLAGWSPKQIKAALADEANAGGAYYRWRIISSPGFLDYQIENTTTATAEQPCTASTGGNCSTGLKKVDPDIWVVLEDGFEVRRKTARALLTYVTSGPMGMTQARQSGCVHPRAAQTYLNALRRAGLITITPNTRLKARDGKQRKCTVVRAASPETVADALASADVPERDRDLWKTLSDLYKPAEPVVYPEPDWIDLLVAGERSKDVGMAEIAAALGASP